MYIKENMEDNFSLGDQLLIDWQEKLDKRIKLEHANEKIANKINSEYFSLKLKKCDENSEKCRILKNECAYICHQLDCIIFYSQQTRKFLKFIDDNYYWITYFINTERLFYKYYTFKDLNLIERFILSQIPAELLEIRQ